ncbi:UNVERIFIED_ORG: putative TIM-barrel fold metal-dependent hydrolase [Burkholderia sp. CF145]
MNAETPDSEYHGTMVRTTDTLQEWHRAGEVETALDPQMPIVDAHHHLFGTAADRLYYRVEDLQDDISGGHNVIGTIYCEAYYSGWHKDGPDALRPVGEVQNIVRAAQEVSLTTAHGPCELAAAVVAHTDMTLGHYVAEVLEAHVAAGAGRLRGVRHRTATDLGRVGSFIESRPAPHLLINERFQQGVRQLASFGLSFDAWVYHTQIDELISLVDSVPDTTVVVDHIGGPIGVAEYRPYQADVTRTWKRKLHELAERPNVMMKVGGMGMAVFGFGFEREIQPAGSAALASAWRPYIDTCIEAFGTDRCLFESNFPVDKQSTSYTSLWNAFKRCTAELSFSERCDLFFGTACRAYQLPHLAERARIFAEEKGLAQKPAVHV